MAEGGHGVRTADVYAALSKITRPIYAANASEWSCLDSPSDFYATLCAGVRSAQQKIVLVSLYLGNGQQEQELVELIRQRCHETPGLQVHIMIDYLRGHRRDKNDGSSSVGLLSPLVEAFPDQVKVSLFHTPELRGLSAAILPARWNEGCGLQHMKGYIWDDHIVMSGANLEHAYFTNRQDRYISMPGESEIVQTFLQLVNAVAKLSFQLQLVADGKGAKSLKPQLEEGVPHPTKETVLYKAYATRVLGKALKNLEPRGSSVDRSAEEMSISGLNEQHTMIFLTCQLPPFSIVQDEQATYLFLKNLKSGGSLTIASPYFNLTSNHVNAILSSAPAVDVCVASPKANGFFGASGAAGMLPAAYTLFESEFFNTVKRRGQDLRIRLHEYDRAGWTYHAKGMWYTAPGDTAPCMTTIGSPNLGSRSVNTDLEAQFFILTQNAKLKAALKREQDSVLARTHAVTASMFQLSERKVRSHIHLFANIIRRYL